MTTDLDPIPSVRCVKICTAVQAPGVLISTADYMKNTHRTRLFLIVVQNMPPSLECPHSDPLLPEDNQKDTTKGCHHEGKVQFFLTLFKRALTPPPLLFEHLSYFAGGVCIWGGGCRE